MPAFHSSFNKKPVKVIGGVALLPIIPKYSKGPAPRPDAEDGDVDIVDETLKSFKSNVFFQSFDVKGPADRLLIFLTLYVSQAIGRMGRCIGKDSVLKEMYTLSIENFALPMDSAFPLAAFYSKIDNKRDQDELRAYLLQCRQELGSRLADLVIDPATNKPSKWWMCFNKRKFLGKSLDGPGK